MGEVFEQATIFRQQPVEHRFAIVLIAVPQNMMMRPCDHLNGVELDISQSFYDAENIERAGWRR